MDSACFFVWGVEKAGRRSGGILEEGPSQEGGFSSNRGEKHHGTREACGQGQECTGHAQAASQPVRHLLTVVKAETVSPQSQPVGK